MTAREMILNSAERGNALLLKSEQVAEAAAWIRDHMAIEEHILNRFFGTFENYEYIGSVAAIDLMNAEVITLRKELADIVSGQGDDDALLNTLRNALGTRDVHGVAEGIDRLGSAVRTFRLATAKALTYEILQERDKQDHQWGGPEHDDEHERYDWPHFIAKFTQRAMASAHVDDAVAIESYESAMVKIAALAVAAIQSSRRKRA